MGFSGFLQLCKRGCVRRICIKSLEDVMSKSTSSDVWMWAGSNYYGGSIYRHPDGFHAIECFNAYHQSIGFEVWEDGTSDKNWREKFLGKVRHVADLP